MSDIQERVDEEARSIAIFILSPTKWPQWIHPPKLSCLNPLGRKQMLLNLFWGHADPEMDEFLQTMAMAYLFTHLDELDMPDDLPLGIKDVKRHLAELLQPYAEFQENTTRKKVLDSMLRSRQAG